MNDQVSKLETAEILRLATAVLDRGVAGDFVELGCYRGDTSILLGRVLAQYNDKDNSSSEIALFDEESNWSLEAGHLSPRKGSRTLWLYDSFAGLPEKSAADASGAGANFRAGELFVTKREVIDKIRKHGLKNIIVKKAWFADLTSADLPAEIAFAFCDGDLYDSIKTSLRLVLPCLADQGIIIVHDYNNPELPGSARAVDEFLRTNPSFRLRVFSTLAILSR